MCVYIYIYMFLLCLAGLRLNAPLGLKAGSWAAPEFDPKC